MYSLLNTGEKKMPRRRFPSQFCAHCHEGKCQFATADYSFTSAIVRWLCFLFAVAGGSCSTCQQVANFKNAIGNSSLLHIPVVTALIVPAKCIGQQQPAKQQLTCVSYILMMQFFFCSPHCSVS